MPISSGFGSNNCNTTIHLPNSGIVNTSKPMPVKESVKPQTNSQKSPNNTLKLNNTIDNSTSQKKTNSQITKTTAKLNDSINESKASKGNIKSSKIDLSFKENFSIKKNVQYMNNRNRLYAPGNKNDEKILSKSNESINEQLNPPPNVLRTTQGLNRPSSEISINYYYEKNPYENLFENNSKEDTLDEKAYQSVQLSRKNYNQGFNNQEYFNTNGKPFKRRPSKYDDFSSNVLKDIGKDEDSMIVSSNSLLSNRVRSNPIKKSDKIEVKKKNAQVQVEPELNYAESSETEYEFEIDADADGEIVFDKRNNFKFLIQDKRRTKPKMSDKELKSLVTQISDKIDEDRKEGLTIYINRDGSKKKNSPEPKKVTVSNSKSTNTNSDTKIERNTKSTNTPNPEPINKSAKMTKSTNTSFQSAEPRNVETPRIINSQGTQTRLKTQEIRNESPTKTFKNSTVQCDLASVADFYEVKDRSPRITKVIYEQEGSYLPEDQYRILPNIRLYNSEKRANNQYVIESPEATLPQLKKLKIINDPVVVREVLARKKSMQEIELPPVQRVSVKNRVFTNIRRPVKFLNQSIV